MAENAKAEGNEAMRSGDFAKAIAKYTEGIEAADSSSSMVHLLYSNRSAAHVAMGNLDEALKDGKKCVELKPDFAKGHARIALVLFRKKLFGSAASAYRKASKASEGEMQQKYEQSAADCEKEERYVRGVESRPAASATSFAVSKPKLGISQSLFLVVRSFQLFLAIAYLLSPILPFAIPPGGTYIAFLSISVASFFLQSAFLHGRPRWDKNYAARLFLDYRTQYCLLTAIVLLLGRGRPYTFQIPMILVVEIGHWGEAVHNLASAIGFSAAGSALVGISDALVPRLVGESPSSWKLRASSAKWSVFNQWSMSLAATFEVSVGFLLLAELMLPTRNLLLFVVYWQLLRMRVMSSVYVKELFQRIDGTIRPFVQRIPVIGYIYRLLTRVLSKLSSVPQPGESRSRCSVM